MHRKARFGFWATSVFALVLATLVACTSDSGVSQDELDAAKEAIGFVSSNCWDALGARSFGFRVHWINRAQAPVDRLGFAPDAIVGGLGDLVGG